MADAIITPWVERRRPRDGGYRPRAFGASEVEGEYLRDRARVIHSAAFRRLQSKTQVLSVGEHDFYRTRLTHSLEVAQIGSGLCDRLHQRHEDEEAWLRWIPPLGLIEAICLAHDIGHPPFGHGGEVALERAMSGHGGFEGNGQTLRIVARLGEYSPEHGFDLTRRALLGVVKYPLLYSEALGEGKGPPKCILDEEAEVLEWILEPFGEAERARFRQSETRPGRHRRPLHKSFDTSIMEIADDIAYGVHDLEDALALEMVDLARWNEEVAEPLQALPGCPLAADADFYRRKLFSRDERERKHAISRLVSYLMGSVEIGEEAGFDHPLLRLRARLVPPADEVLARLKAFVFRNVIARSEVRMLEYKGQQMILRLFEVLVEDPSLVRQYLPEGGSGVTRRAICDYVASLTDRQATKLYHTLFTPSMGSVFDRI